MTELVFIGQDLDQNQLIRMLDDCLLNEYELHQFRKGNFEANEIEVL